MNTLDLTLNMTSSGNVTLYPGGKATVTFEIQWTQRPVVDGGPTPSKPEPAVLAIYPYAPLPSGVTASFSPASPKIWIALAGTVPCTLTLTASPSAPMTSSPVQTGFTLSLTGEPTLSAAISVTVLQPLYQITDLGGGREGTLFPKFPNYPWNNATSSVYPKDIDDDGNVVGLLILGPNETWFSFLYPKGGPIGPVPGLGLNISPSWASGVNENSAGQVQIAFLEQWNPPNVPSPASGYYQPGLVVNGALSSFPGVLNAVHDPVGAIVFPSGFTINACGGKINRQGIIAGSAKFLDQTSQPILFNLSLNGMNPVRPGNLPGMNAGSAMAINDKGQAVGGCGNSPNYNTGGRAFLYQAGSLLDLTSLKTSGPSPCLLQVATAINNASEIVGLASFETNPLAWSGFHYAGGTVRQLAPLSGSTYSMATDINESGTIVGTCWGEQALHASLFEPYGVVFDLNLLIPPGAQPLWQLQVATAINNNGQIIGYGQRRNSDGAGLGMHGFLLTPVLAL